MSWQNYGTAWHIDHVVPKSWFNLEIDNGVDEYELRICWSLQNLQPMWMNENLEKKNRHISFTQQPQSEMTPDQFRVLIEYHKRDQIPLAL
jgi:hypothetical protein